MTPAIRTVGDAAGVRTIEGLAFPFKVRDSYGTAFSARTDYAWQLFPDITPTSGGEPRFTRPLTYHHGFDSTFGLARVGGWSPIGMDADGIWIRGQVDTTQPLYAGHLKPLLDAGALGLSGGSAEHSVRIDASGEILAWPAYELALTPGESNPAAVIASRSAAFVIAGDQAVRLVADAPFRIAGPSLEELARDVAERAGIAAVRRLTGA